MKPQIKNKKNGGIVEFVELLILKLNKIIRF